MLRRARATWAPPTVAAPKLALITLGQEIEKKVRELMAVSGWGPSGRVRGGLLQGLNFLGARGFLALTLAESVKDFWETRNRVVHTGSATDEDALRALDSGIKIFRALQAVPIQSNVVEEPNVPIYQDENLTEPHEGHGVILRLISPGGVIQRRDISPSTRTHFQKGKPVAWEWDMGRTWGVAWYRDPQDGAVKQAWKSSAEFIGRHLDEL